jgi:hypothetical protein
LGRAEELEERHRHTIAVTGADPDARDGAERFFMGHSVLFGPDRPIHLGTPAK